MTPEVLIWSFQLLISFIFFLCSTDSSRKLVDQGASKDGALNNFALIVILILSKKFGLRYLREFWSDGTTKIKMYIDKKKNVHPQKGKCLSIEKLFPRNANEWTHLVGIRLSPRRLGSRRSGQSYASNQHRRGNGFNHRHLSDLQFCTYEQNYYPPTRERSPAQLWWPTEAIGCHVTSKSQDQRLLSVDTCQPTCSCICAWCFKHFQSRRASTSGVPRGGMTRPL